MSQLTITCPSCNETFSADQALQNHLKSKELKFQEEIKVLQSKVLEAEESKKEAESKMMATLKQKEIDYFLDQVLEFFNLEKNFIRNMYKFNNFHKYFN